MNGRWRNDWRFWKWQRYCAGYLYACHTCIFSCLASYDWCYRAYCYYAVIWRRGNDVNAIV